MNRFILVDEKNFVIGVRFGKEPVEAEIQSEYGEVGQRYENGQFIDVPIGPQEPVESMEEKIARLEQQLMNDNLVLMDALAMTYEEVMLMRSEMNGGTS